MIEVINLAYYSFFGGGSIGNVLAQWEAMGVFSYALPFLLLFALIFGILTKISLFTEGPEKKPNKTINAIIALAVALMALQFDFVSRFFSEIFPRVGVALSIILVILILGGLFLPVGNKGFNWGLIAVVWVIIAIVIFQSLESFGWGGGGYYLRNYGGNILGLVIFVGIIVAIVAGASSKPREFPETILSRALGSSH